MLIMYDSKTGNVERFIQKLDMEAIKIEPDMLIDEPFVLITYTTGFGQVPPKVMEFLENNAAFMVGVAASGNRNWGNNFGKSADTISSMYHVPVIYKFELSGTQNDVSKFKEGVMQIETHRIK